MVDTKDGLLWAAAGVAFLAPYLKADITEWGTTDTGAQATLTEIKANGTPTGIYYYNDGTTITLAPTGSKKLLGLGNTSSSPGSINATMTTAAEPHLMEFGSYEVTSTGDLISLGGPKFPIAFDDGYASFIENGLKKHFAFDNKTGSVFMAEYDGNTWATQTFATGLKDYSDIGIDGSSDVFCLRGFNSNGSLDMSKKSTPLVGLDPKYLSKTVGDGVSHILFSTPGVGLAYGVQTSTDLVNWVDEPTIRSTGNTYIFTHNHDGNNFVRMSKK